MKFDKRYVVDKLNDALIEYDMSTRGSLSTTAAVRRTAFAQLIEEVSLEECQPADAIIRVHQFCKNHVAMIHSRLIQQIQCTLMELLGISFTPRNFNEKVASLDPKIERLSQELVNRWGENDIPPRPLPMSASPSLLLTTRPKELGSSDLSGNNDLSGDTGKKAALSKNSPPDWVYRPG